MLWALQGIGLDSLLSDAGRIEKLGLIGVLGLWALIATVMCVWLVKRSAFRELKASDRDLKTAEVLGQVTLLLRQLQGIPSEMLKHHGKFESSWRDFERRLAAQMKAVIKAVESCPIAAQGSSNQSSSSGRAGRGQRGSTTD